ncbi:MAG: heme exporter protein CcmB, partial [Proteobacteria bacterium]|nr:heme exporter protein CcmB [Pseudomonadota bacterium]
DLNSYPILVATTLIGTPAVSFLGAIGAALTMKTRRGGLLLAVIVLPFYVPTLIFGISAVSASAGPDGLGASFLILAAVSLVAVVLGPVAAAAALRIQLQ